MTMYGYSFVLNGTPTKIELPQDPTAVQLRHYEDAKRVFKKHSHFKVVTPALLREEAEAAAKLAAEAAKLAMEEAERAEEEARAQVDEAKEVAEDGVDEVATDNPGATVPGRSGGRRRG